CPQARRQARSGMRHAPPAGSVAGGVGYADHALAIGGHCDLVFATTGIDLLAGHILAHHAVILAPPAAIEPRLRNLDLDRFRLRIGQRVAHRGAVIGDRSLGFALADNVAVADHLPALVAFPLVGRDPLALFDLSLHENVERIARAQRKLAAHRRVADAVLADELRIAAGVALVKTNHSGGQRITQPAIARAGEGNHARYVDGRAIAGEPSDF